MIEAPDRYVGTEIEWGLMVNAADPAVEYPNVYLENVQYTVFRALHEFIRTKRNNTRTFQTDGSRLYDDHQHIETSSHESLIVANAVQAESAVTTQLKADFEEFADMMHQEGLLSDLRIFLTKKNTLQDSDVSWGVHENYTVRLSPYKEIKTLAPDVIPHLVTRTIFTGAGGVRGDDYVLSPRSLVHFQETGLLTTQDRPIFNTRDRPLSNNLYLRCFHNILSEGNVSPWQTHIKLGSTKLLLKAIEDGASFADLKPRNPVKTLHAIARDLNFEHQFETAGGRTMTAVEVQQEILNRVTEYATTDEERLVLEHWQRMLDEILIFQKTQKITKYLANNDAFAKLFLYQRPKNIRSLASIDSSFAILATNVPDEDKRIGFKMYERGFFDLTPDPDKVPVISNRARMRGMIVEAKCQKIAVGWCNVAWPSDGITQAYALPDFPTDEQVKDLEQALQAKELPPAPEWLEEPLARPKPGYGL